MTNDVHQRPFHFKIPEICNPQSSQASLPIKSVEHTPSADTYEQPWSGSLPRRVFMGTGLALLTGAVTLLVFNPSPEPVVSVSSDMKHTSDSASEEVPYSAELNEEVRDSQVPRVELTVSAGEEFSGPEPAMFDDPFVPENQVHGKPVMHAVHFDRNSSGKGHILRATHRSDVLNATHAGPAWLNGTIETSDFDSNSQ